MFCRQRHLHSQHVAQEPLLLHLECGKAPDTSASSLSHTSFQLYFAWAILFKYKSDDIAWWKGYPLIWRNSPCPYNGFCARLAPHHLSGLKSSYPPFTPLPQLHWLPCSSFNGSGTPPPNPIPSLSHQLFPLLRIPFSFVSCWLLTFLQVFV